VVEIKNKNLKQHKMSEALLHKTHTGIASEFFVAGELARRGFNVTLTFGNTKAIDLLIEKDGKLIPVQVKGIQRTSSICWNVNLEKLNESSLMFVLVNLHADTLKQPEYFVLTSAEVKKHFKPAKGRDYLDYNLAVKLNLKDKWDKISNAAESTATIVSEENEAISTKYWDGFCPESAFEGKEVRMRLNNNDFYESEVTGLQMAVFPGVQAIILNFRGEGKFRSSPGYADEITDGEFLSPQTKAEGFFNDGEIFQSNAEVEKFISEIIPAGA